MKTNSFLKNFFIQSIGGAVFLVLFLGLTTVANGQNAPDGGMEVLMRGPIHEAFAEVSVNMSEPGMVINLNVPDPIDEIPPDYRPEGNDVEWIPGYWSWDDERNDFIWVSGVWREVPPGRQWVPGYWSSYDGSSQYISGFWDDIEQTETLYLPPPPAPQVSGPSSRSSTPNEVWIEGSWVWYENRYVWQPGYWMEERYNQVWVPSHYVWSPMGYIFLRGYWDYHMSHRGVMFAPLYYPRPTYRQQGYYYTPSIVLDIDALFFSLFVRASSHHYYFGDYYDARYENRGYQPWYSERATPYGYDPYYVNYRSRRIREDRNWENRYHEQYQYRRDHQEARPPHTFALQSNYNYKQNNVTTNAMLGRRLNDVVKDQKQPVRFTEMKSEQKKIIQTRNQELKKFKVERKDLEKAPMVNGKPQKPADISKPRKLKMPKSPVKANPGNKFDSGKPQGKPQIKPQDQQQMKPKGNPQVKPQDQQQMKPKGNPPVKPQDQQQMKPKGNPQVKPQDQQQMKPKGNPPVKPQDQQQMKPKGNPPVKPQDQQMKPKGNPPVKPQDQQMKPKGNPPVKPQDQQMKPKGNPPVKPQDQQMKPQGNPQGKPKGKDAKKLAEPDPLPTNTPVKLKTN